jgi:hypothetical protein
MQYLSLLQPYLTFNLQNEAALLRNKTTQSQSIIVYLILRGQMLF